jgi:hypothetical protein
MRKGTKHDNPSRVSTPSIRAARREVTPLEVRYGPVLISGGQHRGRIGYYDDDDYKGAIIYFGDFFMADGYFIIPRRFCKYPTLDALLKRRDAIPHRITWANTQSRLTVDEKYDMLAELHFIDGVINERMFFARYGEPT